MNARRTTKKNELPEWDADAELEPGGTLVKRPEAEGSEEPKEKKRVTHTLRQPGATLEAPVELRDQPFVPRQRQRFPQHTHPGPPVWHCFKIPEQLKDLNEYHALAHPRHSPRADVTELARRESPEGGWEVLVAVQTIMYSDPR